MKTDNGLDMTTAEMADQWRETGLREATCCLCGWTGIGPEAHGTVIHSDIRTAVIRQMDDLFIVSLDAANPAPAGLDVERLARAVAEAYVGDYEAEWFDDAAQPIPHVMAPQIAAEYARLSEGTEPE